MTITYSRTGTSSDPAVGTLDSGSVLFANAAGEISEDNANFFWDDTNNKLILGGDTNLYRSGVGTLKTDGVLSAVGNIAASADIIMQNDVAAAQAIQSGGTNGLKIGTATTQKLAFFGATPVVQQASITSPTSDIAGTKAAIDALITVLENLGFVTAN